MNSSSPSPRPASVGPLTDQQYWQDHWQARTKLKRLSAWHGLWGTRGNFISLLERTLGPLGGKRVLEIGGGYSIRLLALAKFRGCRCTALDFSALGLQATRELFSFNGCPVETLQADMFSHQFADRHDVVCHWGVLEHFQEPAEVLRISAAATLPGGFVVFSMPNLEAWAAKLWQEYAPRNHSHHILHTDAVVRAACEAAGLELVRATHWGVPLIRIAPWERGGAWLHLLTAAQMSTYAAAAILPVFGYGSRGFSNERLFFARRS